MGDLAAAAIGIILLTFRGGGKNRFYAATEPSFFSKYLFCCPPFQ
ncbi:MAG: hypothetical protein ACI8S3_000561 [Alphaproteobacteria bacterium]|jgi:hypothetical protein